MTNLLSKLSNLKSIATVLESTAAEDAPVVGCSIDSRSLRTGELFFALKGPRADGHNYVEQALASGAAGAVVEAARGLNGPRLIAVPDTLAALQRLAAKARQLWGRRLVAVTGSTGKTTTKEMIAAALAAPHRGVRKNKGNLNNEYGLPLSLLGLSDEDEAGVFELGMSHAGEIAALARLAQPDTGVVTCVAPVHLEFFDNLEGIARAKYELIEALPSGGVAVLNADDPVVSRFAFSGRVLKYGMEQPADFRAEDIQEGATVSFRALGQRFELRLPGRHNVLNALAALAVASTFAVPAAEVAQALAAFRPLKMRGETLEVNGATIINDCYNSNPQALRFMLEHLERVPARGRRLAVLGEMLELGSSGPDLHAEGGALAARAADYLLAVRGLARHFLEGARAAGMAAERMRFVETPEEAGEALLALLEPGDLVLMKGSRGVGLEKALEKLRAPVKAGRP